MEQTPATVLLETSKPGSDSVSRLFIDPLRVLEARESADLPALFAQIEDATAKGYFAAGSFAYECGQYFEPKVAARAGTAQGSPSYPLAWLGIYERCYRFDHDSGVFVDGDPSGLTELRNQDPAPQSSEPAPLEIIPGLSEGEFGERIQQIHEWIRAGDVYQLNFTFPLRMRITERPAVLYARLRRRQPVEYGAFLHCQAGRHILSFSPELFFRVEREGTSRLITAQPMKGTARRGRTTAEDRQIAEWLHNDIKNRSENVMIVDLIRNDLGRLCNYGSVRVESLFDVESYATLWQMTSTVTGTLDLEGEHATMGVGGGIVIDSDAMEEFRECQLKAGFLTRAEEPFSLIESLLWQRGYPFIELHLDRLEDSSEFFGFACDRTAVKVALLTVANSFPNQPPRKVRLLLDFDGNFHIEDEEIQEISDTEPPRIGRVRIASQRTDPDDRFFFHKTTRRPLYDNASKAAKEAGFDDVLFLNTRGEISEGAVNNVFIEKNGRWLTPPVSCGLLPGIYRRHLLETRRDIEERILYLRDLRTADAIYLTNAVRGLRRVTIDWES